jgi:hypothetical protein
MPIGAPSPNRPVVPPFGALPAAKRQHLSKLWGVWDDDAVFE